MIQINNENGGSIHISVENHTAMDAPLAQDIANAIQANMREHLNILVSLHGITKINSDGFNILYNITQTSAGVRSILKFTNVSDEIEELINTLTMSAS